MSALTVSCKWKGCEQLAAVRVTFCAEHASISTQMLRQHRSIGNFASWLISNVSAGVLSNIVFVAFDEAVRAGLLSQETMQRVLDHVSTILASSFAMDSQNNAAASEQDIKTILGVIDREGLDQALAAALADHWFADPTVDKG